MQDVLNLVYLSDQMNNIYLKLKWRNLCTKNLKSSFAKFKIINEGLKTIKICKFTATKKNKNKKIFCKI